jgi:hypothetical protein
MMLSLLRLDPLVPGPLLFMVEVVNSLAESTKCVGTRIEQRAESSYSK